MSVDNRTELNDCDSVTGWTGDGAAPAVNTTVGQRYQGTGSIESQHSNTDDHMSTTEDSLNTGTFVIDMSDSTLYLLLKDNLVDTLANGGIQYVIGDGTNKVGYDVGGNDAIGLPLNPFFNGYKLDVSNRPAVFNAYAGSEGSLAVASITEVGVGTLHLAKAVGNVANIFVDYISYIANGSAVLTINGGTSGTPETMVDVQGDDVTNGWGLIANPFGSQYLFYGPTEWGDAGTADSYFTASDEQWYWIGDTVGAGNFDFALIANGTGTNSFVLDNVVIVNLDVRSAFNLAPANHNIMKMDSVTLTDLGAITMPAQSVGNKYANDCIFNNCDQIDPDTLDMDGCIFNGTTDANGALLIASTTDNMSGFSFNSDGSGHGAYITAQGTSIFDGHKFTGYGSTGTTDAAIFNDSGGNVIINVINGGDSPTYRNGAGASTTVNNPKIFTFTGIASATEVRLYHASTDAELAGIEQSSTTFQYSYNYTADIPIYAVLFHLNFKEVRYAKGELTLGNADQSIPVQQAVDRIYSNPV